MTMPSRTISSSERAYAPARRSLPSMVAARQRWAMLTSGIQCMLAPMATDGCPRDRRLEATSRSWTDSTPIPPSSCGTGAAR